MGIPVDFVDMSCDLSQYKVFIAPMMYMTKNNIEGKIKDFVEAGGIFVTTYWSGIVNETDLCHLGGWPHGLMDVVGLRSEEIDGLFDGEYNSASNQEEENLLGHQAYKCSQLCDRVLCHSAKPLLTYDKDFYKGEPALTVNTFGKGDAYYICSRFEEPFYRDFYEMLVDKYGIKRTFGSSIPKGVSVTSRQGEDAEYIFIQNFNEESVIIDLSLENLESIDGKKDLSSQYELEPYEVIVARREL